MYRVAAIDTWPSVPNSFLSATRPGTARFFSTISPKGRPEHGVAVPQACIADVQSRSKQLRLIQKPLERQDNWTIPLRHFTTSRAKEQSNAAIGAEPGIGPKSERSHFHLDAASEIKIMDYSDQAVAEHDLTKDTLEAFLKERERPDWAACRWIYVNGLNWDVVRMLGKYKRLHRLAIEDVLDTSTLTKVDWYEDHCFMEMNLQKLVQQPPLAQKDPDEHFNDIAKAKAHNAARVKRRTFSHPHYAISVEQVSVFLTEDNTIVTIFENSGEDILQPILTRLQSPQTMIRSSNDPSMLIQAVIDAIVDLSMSIGKAMGEAFSELEYAVLSKPSVAQSKQLYVLRSALALLNDNTTAIGGLVKTLCDHRALQTSLESGQGPASASPKAHHLPTKVQISPLSQVYLQDVQDHILTLSNSTRMSIRSAENLTGLIFNTIAATQNESVRQLTLVSSFFLPLTFLTGYFGMNFDPMPIVNNHSDAYFWLIATPVMLGTSLLLLTRAARMRRPFAWMRRKHD